MSEHNGSKLLLAFLAGAAAGVALGYFLNSDKADELLKDAKETATKLKADLKEEIGKVKDMVSHKKAEKAPETETTA
jgi:hypothetical protein